MDKQKNMLKMFDGVKVKGLKTPNLFVWVRGWLDGRKGYLIKKDGEWTSNYIKRKERDFQNCAAVVYRKTGELLKDYRNTIIQQEVQLEYLENQINGYSKGQSEQHNLSVKELRQQRTVHNKVNQLLSEKQQIFQNIAGLKQEINTVEFVAEEWLLATKRDLESKITVYFQGARKYLNERGDSEIPEDHYAKEIYLKRTCNQSV